MKKKLFKVILIITVTVALMCCCCFSVFAATSIFDISSTNRIVASPDFSTDPYSADITFYEAVSNADGSYTFQIATNRTGSYLNLLCDGGFSDRSSDNVLSWSQIDLDFYISSSAAYTESVSLCLHGEAGQVSEKLTTVPINKSGSFKVSIPAGMATLSSEDPYSGVYGVSILLEGNYATPSASWFVYQSFEFSMTRTSSEAISNEALSGIVSDKYVPPSSNDVDDTNALEDQIADNAAAGLDSAADMFTGFSGIDLRDPLSAVIQIYNCFLPRLTWLDLLLTISLTLGLVGFLFGMSQLIVAKANARDRENKRRKG